jgi:hypothetical protein
MRIYEQADESEKAPCGAIYSWIATALKGHMRRSLTQAGWKPLGRSDAATNDPELAAATAVRYNVDIMSNGTHQRFGAAGLLCDPTAEPRPGPTVETHYKSIAASGLQVHRAYRRHFRRAMRGDMTHTDAARELIADLGFDLARELIAAEPNDPNLPYPDLENCQAQLDAFLSKSPEELAAIIKRADEAKGGV